MSRTLAAMPGLMLSSELAPSELIRLSALAEDVGYGQLWYTDQRFWRDCYAGLSLIAQNTSRILLGPGVNDPFTRHPALIAMSIATLDELSGGRAQLGLGVGGSGIVEMHLPKQRPVRALKEAIEIIRSMFAEKSVDYEGEIFRLTGASLGFTPDRAGIPVYVATHGPQVLKLSGQVADGVLLGNMGRREAVDQAVGIVHASASTAGRPPGEVKIDVRLEAIITEDSHVALSVMRKRLAHRLVVSYPNWGYLGDQASRLDPDIADAARLRDTARVEAMVTDDDVRATALVGDPTDVARQVTGLLSPGVGNVTIRPYAAPGVAQDETIQLFAEHVWPMVTAKATTHSS